MSDSQPQPIAAERVSAERAHELQQQGHTMVDVRTVEEYAAGHPVAAYNVPVMQRESGGMKPNPAFVATMQALFATDTALLLSCRSGRRSARAAGLLAKVGFGVLVDVAPGYGGVRDSFGQLIKPGWKDADLPIELETPGRSYAELLETVKRDV